MDELRNVIVFVLGTTRYALELRWVREVVSLGFVTGAVGGVCNLHGTILPVLDVAALLDQPPGPPVRQGDGALVIELDGVVCALRVDQVENVGSLPEHEGAIVDAGGRELTLLDPTALVRRAQEVLTAAPAEQP